MADDRIEQTSLLLLHALISMGHPLTEKTVDDAITLAELHAKKLEARFPAEVTPVPKDEIAPAVPATAAPANGVDVTAPGAPVLVPEPPKT